MTRRRLRPRVDTILRSWSIYGPNQHEHPGKYVVRPWYSSDGRLWSGVARVFDSLDEARASIDNRLTRFNRHVFDDASLLETWI